MKYYVVLKQNEITTMLYHYTPTRMSNISKTDTPNVGMDAEKPDQPDIAG